jgi:DNA-binding GntR family transcriptional regulator
VDAVERSDAAKAAEALAHHIATIVDLGPEVFANGEH